MVLSFRGKDLGILRNTLCKEHLVNMGWEYVACFAYLKYTLNTCTHVHTHAHAQQNQAVPRHTGHCCILQVLGCNDHKPRQISNITRDSYI